MTSRMAGLSGIGWIIAIPFVLVGLAIVALIYCEVDKAYWDSKVKALCEQDGALKYLKQLRLTSSNMLFF